MAARNLLDLLETQVRRHPESIACVDDSRALSYRELHERARSGAAALREAGVSAGDHVGVFLHPSVDLIGAVWAILRASASYVPLSVDYPAERLSYMAADSGLRVVITDGDSDATARRILPARVRTVRVDAVADRATELPPHPPGPASAYTIYTSGTTGTPKGVVIAHHAITNQMSWLADELGLGPGSRILLKTPVGFDAAQWELLANACGATIVVAPAGTHTSPEDLVEYVRREAITILQCVPTMWAELVAAPELAAAGTLHTVVSGGEALSVPLAERLRSALPGPRKINLYGPTETTINATWFDFTDAALTGTATVPIGRAVRGCTSVVVDESGRPVADDTVGELLVGGVQVAAGYLGLPEVTARRFVEFPDGAHTRRMYRTGDLVRRRGDGVLEFVGRNDEQVKVNGHRVETNEVRVSIEAHHWVRAAAVVPVTSERGVTRLAGFVELDPDEAPLMDQGRDARHHRSKSTHLQVSAQLADLAVRVCADEPEFTLAGAEPDADQRRRVFARKTYRTFAERPIDLSVIRSALDLVPGDSRPAVDPARVEALTAARLGSLLRWFGPFHSRERLLPKYSYASPGALNATQIYLETDGVPGLAAGTYYFHPLRHSLFRVGAATRSGVRLHLVGVPEAIESVYATNVREVLHFEAGHILGVLDEVAAEYGWRVLTGATGAVEGVTDGVVTASVALSNTTGAENTEARVEHDDTEVSVLVQVQGAVEGARHGLYTYTPSGLIPRTEQKIERRHVIAINQRSYDQAPFGVLLLVGRSAGWAGFTALGRTLAHLQQIGTRTGLGFMSAGYSSLTGRDLPSARRIGEIADRPGTLSYFALAGPVTAEQLGSTGMAEDAVHMRGPEELLKDDLRTVLPHYMVPPTIQVLDRIPHSSNGKQDRTELVRIATELADRTSRIEDPPKPGRESEVAQVWARVLDYRPVYREDDFFANGGNSMSALRLIRALNERLGVELPVQSIFRAPTPRQLAEETVRVQSPSGSATHPSRLLRLAGDGEAATTVLWPGLGGYPMSLRTLAGELAEHGHAVYGVQARGINAGEHPHHRLDELVADDVDELLGLGRSGPLRIVGYSFGARVAAEVAQRLTAAGREVEQLVLIAPGSPVLAGINANTEEVSYRNRYFKRVLASVFSGRVDPAYGIELDTKVTVRDEFIDLIAANETGFARATVDRIVAVVEHTYRFRAERSGVDQDLLDRSLFLRARGDGPSFADIPPAPLRPRVGPVSNLPYHHYEIVTAGALDIAAAVLERTVLAHTRNRELV
ncbi:non-ribosomal peptide synthetase [Nocardia callitridis]|uniref:Carrier domain-containing protein n=1 Tax=Nocardia callitridis TaxID=648753 RepID=A0ABP9L5Z5_9NOCA